MNEPLEKNELSFLYEGNKQIAFSVPDGGINIISPAKASYSSFTSSDIDSSAQDLIWLANITFERIKENMISGKYSIRLAAASIAEQYDAELTDAKSLESYQVHFYKQEYGINKEFHIVQAGNYSWVTNKSVNGNQVVVSAFLALDNRHYLVFSFEYLGDDQKEVAKLQKIVNSTLESFKLKNV
ncbi:hypothetical protein [Aliikangiella sp. IMCC44632]